MVNAYHFKEYLRLVVAQENFKCSQLLQFLNKKTNLSETFPNLKAVLKIYILLITNCETEKDFVKCQ